MKREPAFLFYSSDWLGDSKLSSCSPATRGIWIDLICVIRDRDHDGSVTDSIPKLARLSRCSTRELRTALRELADRKVINLTTEKPGVFRIHQDRLEEDIKERKSERARKLAEREAKKSAAGERKTSVGQSPEKVAESSRARATPDSVPDSSPKKLTAADSQKQTPAADPLDGGKDKDPLTRSLILEAHCENLTAPDLEVFREATSLVRSGKLDEQSAHIAAGKAAAGRRNKAGLFKTLIDKFRNDT